MTDRLKMNRRQFVVSTASVGGGMALGLLPKPDGAALAAAGDTEINAWIVINADDTILLRVPVNYQGNGGPLAPATYICEELACAWEKVTAEFADIQRHNMQNKVYQQFGQV